jgi:ribonuclease HI
MTQIDQACAFLEDVGKLLREKNAAYGDSALSPVRIFSQANPADGLRVRIDDKLSRVAKGAAGDEDVLRDLVGYLALLWVAEHPQDPANQAAEILAAHKRRKEPKC